MTETVNKRRRICLYGNSVILGTVAAGLSRFSQYEIVSISSPLAEGPELKALEPEVVLFDLEAPRPEPAFSLLESHPGLLLIGLSPDSNLVRVWSGRQLRELTIEDLVEVIDGSRK